MGKGSNVNPSLSKPKRKTNPETKRKTRSDKLHDIKIPITDELDRILRIESRKVWNGSKTAMATDILLFGLDNLFIYPEVAYKDQAQNVHCKVDHQTYERIGNHAANWKCSIRKAAHRIFIEACLKKQYGGYTDGEI